jgi:hypothetical protein
MEKERRSRRVERVEDARELCPIGIKWFFVLHWGTHLDDYLRTLALLAYFNINSVSI